MSSSLRTAPPPPFSQHSSPFLNPTPFRLSTSCLTKRRRYRISFIRNSSTPPDPLTSPPPSVKSDVFGGRRELTGIQPLVDSLSPPLRLASSALIVAGAIAAGYGLGFRFGKSQNTALGGAVAFGAAGGAAAYALNACVPEVAAVSLHNYVAECDPGAVKKEDIEEIAKK